MLSIFSSSSHHITRLKNYAKVLIGGFSNNLNIQIFLQAKFLNFTQKIGPNSFFDTETKTKTKKHLKHI